MQPLRELCPFAMRFLSWPQDWAKVLVRLKKLEEAQQATVETSLQNVRVLLKSPNFSKSKILDGLLSLKLISKERNHAKAGFYGSVFQAMSQKAAFLDDVFNQYL